MVRIPTVISASLVYAATRHERMSAILRHAAGVAIRILGLLAVILAILMAISLSGRGGQQRSQPPNSGNPGTPQYAIFPNPQDLVAVAFSPPRMQNKEGDEMGKRSKEMGKPVADLTLRELASERQRCARRWCVYGNRKASKGLAKRLREIEKHIAIAGVAPPHLRLG